MRRLVAAAATVAIALTGVLLSPPTSAEAHTSGRIAGSDRYETSAMISQRSEWSGSTVFLASGVGFADALAAAPVVAAERAHFMLTDPNFVPASVMWELGRLGTREVVVVGGTPSISENVVTQLRTTLGVTVTRIGGVDRVHTSQLLLERLRRSGPIDDVWVVSGATFPDALVAGSVAGRNRSGILLAYHEMTEAGAGAWVDRVRGDLAGHDVRIAGGAPSVSTALDWRIQQVGATSVSRYAGADRYETARIIHDAFSPTAPGGTMLLASGQNFPDALSIASFAALHQLPLYLAPAQCHDGVATMLRQERDERGVTAVLGVGGTPSLSDHAIGLANCPLPPPPPPVVQPPVVQPPVEQPPHTANPGLNVNCRDFPSRAVAQAWWNYWSARGYSNPGRLDGNDRDGRVCESWP